MAAETFGKMHFIAKNSQPAIGNQGRMKERKMALATTSERPKAQFKALKILVVEDERDTADSLAMLLRLGGHQVEVAYTGQIALLLAQRHKPDVVLLDLGLPRVDGYQVVRQLRSKPETQDAFIIAVTGYGSDADRERCKAAGFDLHLLKPIVTEKLLALLRGDPALLLERG
jgi:CheY-like chemotaxis protein